MTVWLLDRLVLCIHDEQLSEHGGDTGLRDAGLLASALARPLNLAGYGNPSPAALGATYALAISRNHPFVDGNKRTGWAAMTAFFLMNGVTFEPPDAEAVVTMMALAAGELTDDEFVAWVEQHASHDD